MFLESSFNELFEKTDNHCKQLLSKALAGIPPEGAPLHMECFEDLYNDPENEDRVFLVETGAVGQEQDGKTLFHFDSGDLFGLDRSEEAPRSKFYAESPVELIAYKRDALLKAATANTDAAMAWCNYLLAECSRHCAVVSSMEQPIDRASLGFQTYNAGEVIIEEGTLSDSVYSIVEGHADVFVKGIKVGEVLEDEIFGAMSLLANSPRTATVTADTRCLVMVVPRNQFEVMIKTHPRICISLMENMARQIMSLNEKIAESNKASA